MKTCPYCAEPIQDAAVLCKHCRSSLVEGAGPPLSNDISAPQPSGPLKDLLPTDPNSYVFAAALSVTLGVLLSLSWASQWYSNHGDVIPVATTLLASLLLMYGAIGAAILAPGFRLPLIGLQALLLAVYAWGAVVNISAPARLAAGIAAATALLWVRGQREPTVLAPRVVGLAVWLLILGQLQHLIYRNIGTSMTMILGVLEGRSYLFSARYALSEVLVGTVAAFPLAVFLAPRSRPSPGAVLRPKWTIPFFGWTLAQASRTVFCLVADTYMKVKVFAIWSLICIGAWWAVHYYFVTRRAQHEEVRAGSAGPTSTIDMAVLPEGSTAPIPSTGVRPLLTLAGVVFAIAVLFGLLER